MAKSKLARGDGHLGSDTPIVLTETPGVLGGFQ